MGKYTRCLRHSDLTSRSQTHDSTPSHHDVERTRNKGTYSVEQGPPKGQQRREGSYSQNRGSATIKRQVRHFHLHPRPRRPTRRYLLYFPDTQVITTQRPKVRYSGVLRQPKPKLTWTASQLVTGLKHSIKEHRRGISEYRCRTEARLIAVVMLGNFS